MNYMNEFDPFAAEWCRNLIGAGLIPPAVVDERDIREVTGGEVQAYTQAHFFAGVAGWPRALDLAGWPATRPVWTASLPCQPFSGAGKRKGQADERHLWPVFFRLLCDCRPAICFGEQVASDDGYRWLARIRDDLEEAGYAVGAADLPACSAGAPHIRQRLFWVAVARLPEPPAGRGTADDGARKSRHGPQRPGGDVASPCGATRRLDDAPGQRAIHQRQAEPGSNGAQDRVPRAASSACGLGNADGSQRGPDGRGDEDGGGPGGQGAIGTPGGAGSARGVFHPASNGRGEGRAESNGRGAAGRRGAGGVGDAEQPRPQGHGRECGLPEGGGQGEARWASAACPASGGFWDDFALIPCADGKSRRIPGQPQPGVQSLASRLPDDLAGVWAACSPGHPLTQAVPGRVGLLRGAGNSIVPQAAAVFVRAVMDILEDNP